MKDYLFKIHANLKEAWCNLIAYEVVGRGGEVVINYDSPIYDEKERTVIGIKHYSKIKMLGNALFALRTIEYFSPNNDYKGEGYSHILSLSMNELFEIADRL